MSAAKHTPTLGQQAEDAEMEQRLEEQFLTVVGEP